MTEEEYGKWLRPGQARDVEPSLGEEAFGRYLLKRLTSGLFIAVAQRIEQADGFVTRFSVVPQRLWSHASLHLPEFWTAGDLEIHETSRGITILSRPLAKVFGVRLDPKDFQAPAADPLETKTVRSKGGKPAGHHGAPIASLTKRLLALSPGELQEYKIGTLTGELLHEYRRWGAPRPSEENARKLAADILRALRN